MENQNQTNYKKSISKLQKQDPQPGPASGLRLPAQPPTLPRGSLSLRSRVQPPRPGTAGQAPGPPCCQVAKTYFIFIFKLIPLTGLWRQLNGLLQDSYFRHLHASQTSCQHFFWFVFLSLQKRKLYAKIQHFPKPGIHWPSPSYFRRTSFLPFCPLTNKITAVNISWETTRSFPSCTRFIT